MSSVKIDTLMYSGSKQFPLCEVTWSLGWWCFHQKFSFEGCKSLANVFETLWFRSSSTKGNHKLTYRANRLAKKCRHIERLCDAHTRFLRCTLSVEHVVILFRLVGNRWWPVRLYDVLTMGTRTHSPYQHTGLTSQLPHCQFHPHKNKDQ